MNRQSVSIRPAEGRDAPAIHELSAELGYSSTLDAASARLEQLIELPAEAVFVAENGTGAVVGWVHVFSAHRLESDAFAEIGGLVVAGDLRGRGIGTSLIDEAHRWARSRGFAKLRIRSRSDRTGAHRFFAATGFAECKAQKVFDATLSRVQSDYRERD